MRGRNNNRQQQYPMVVSHQHYQQSQGMLHSKPKPPLSLRGWLVIIGIIGVIWLFNGQNNAQPNQTQLGLEKVDVSVLNSEGVILKANANLPIDSHGNTMHTEIVNKPTCVMLQGGLQRGDQVTIQVLRQELPDLGRSTQEIVSACSRQGIDLRL